MKTSVKKAAALAVAAMLMTTALAGCGGEKKAEAPKAPVKVTKINFPTAGASGALYAVGAAITNMWNQKVPGVQAASQASKGGINNLNLVADGEAQVSIAISSNCYQALNGTDSFKGHQFKDLKAIAGLYMNPNQVVVTEKSGIKTLADVKGKKFAVAAAGSSVYSECKTHFTAVGLKFPEDINTQPISFGDAADMLQNGTIDGAWIMSGAPAPAVSQAVTAGCRIIDIDKATIDNMKKDYPWYASYQIPAGTYPKQDKAVNTSAIKMVMFTSDKLSEDVVYNLTKAFWTNIDELGKSQKNLKGLKAEDAVKDIANLPLHPGAVKYYKEIGVLK